MSTYPVTERTRVKRGHKRATYDVEQVHTIIDEAFTCHIGAKLADRPMVQPSTHWREGNHLYVHGSTKNALFQALLKGEEACITITLLDGLVMSRSAFHHSVNYRCVMIFSHGELIEDPVEKKRQLNLMMKKITPDRFNDIREPNDKEMKATAVMKFEIKEVSAKVRTGYANEEEEDYALPVWAGIIPLQVTRGAPISEPRWLEDHG